MPYFLSQRKPTRKPSRKPTRRPTHHPTRHPTPSSQCYNDKHYRYHGEDWKDCFWVRDNNHCDRYDEGKHIGREFCRKSCDWCDYHSNTRRPTKKPTRRPTPSPHHNQNDDHWNSGSRSSSDSNDHSSGSSSGSGSGSRSRSGSRSKRSGDDSNDSNDYNSKSSKSKHGSDSDDSRHSDSNDSEDSGWKSRSKKTLALLNKNVDETSRKNESCSAHSQCDDLNLAGACCPTDTGVYLGCCDEHDDWYSLKWGSDEPDKKSHTKLHDEGW
jgi:hypothetical protein